MMASVYKFERLVAVRTFSLLKIKWRTFLAIKVLSTLDFSTHQFQMFVT